MPGTRHSGEASVNAKRGVALLHPKLLLVRRLFPRKLLIYIKLAKSIYAVCDILAGFRALDIFTLLNQGCLKARGQAGLRKTCGGEGERPLVDGWSRGRVSGGGMLFPDQQCITERHRCQRGDC